MRDTGPARWRPWHDAITRIIDRQWPGVRPTVLAGTRLIDTIVGELAPMTPQVVILGAGLQLVADVDAETFRRQTYGPASAAIRGHEFYRVTHARFAD